MSCCGQTPCASLPNRWVYGDDSSPASFSGWQFGDDTSVEARAINESDSLGRTLVIESELRVDVVQDWTFGDDTSISVVAGLPDGWVYGDDGCGQNTCGNCIPDPVDLNVFVRDPNTDFYFVMSPADIGTGQGYLLVNHF